MPERDEEVHSETRPTAVVAFVAASAQTDRTNMVANQAWILSSAGCRVLVVDSGTDLTVHDYLRQLGSDVEIFSSEGVRDTLAELLTASVGSRGERTSVRLRRYPMQSPAMPVDVVNFDVPDSRYLAQTERAATLHSEDARRLRQDLHGLDYDYVLVDLPAMPGDRSGVQVNQTCDVLVVGLTPQQKTIWAAKTLVDQIREGPAGPRIILVTSPFSGSTDIELRRDRNLVFTAFEDLLSGNDPIEHAEVPHQPGHAAHHTIAALIEEPGPHAVAVPAHERLTSVITAGSVTGSGLVTKRMRTRYRLGLGIGEPGYQETLWIDYAPHDRVWADWIAAQIRVPEITVRRLVPDVVVPAGATVILVLSAVLPDWLTGPDAQQRLRSGDFDLVAVRVPDGPPAELTDLTRLVDLTSVDADTGVLALRSALWLLAVDFVPRGVRYPLGQPGGGVPQVNPRFVGREAQIEALREALCPLENAMASPDLRVVSLYGLSGVGKSEITREYANRFGPLYEFVWWISAADEQAVRSRLVDLGITTLKMDPHDLNAPSVLNELATRKRGRWLLVYDNVTGDTANLLLPSAGNGDVIVTSADPMEGGSQFEIVGLDPADSRELLSAPATGLRGITEQHAVAIGAPLGHLPVALQLAASWLRETARTQREALVPMESAVTYAAEELARQLGEFGPAPVAPAELVRRMLRLSTRVLSGSQPGAMAIKLAELCSFLDPDGVALRLLRSKPMLAELSAATGGEAGEALVQDEIEIERVLWTGVRFGLFDVSHGSGPRPEQSDSLRLHRTVQDALHTELAQAGLLHTRRAQLLRGLAGFAPTSVETHPGRKDDFAELHRHLDELDLPTIDFAAMAGELGDAGVPGSDGWNVRRWIVTHIRYLFLEHRVELARSAATLADSVDQAWVAAFGEADHLRCRLAAELATLLRFVSKPDAAMQLNEQVLRFQRRDLGLPHPRTLLTARSFAGDYRERGDFDAALAENEAAWLGFTEVFGEDHPQTLRITFNLAHARFLAGLVAEALELLESSHQVQLRVWGEDDLVVWQTGRLLATYLGELGRYPEAFNYLDKAITRIQRQTELDQIELLHAERAEVVLQRRANARGRDRAEKLTRLVRQFEQRFGMEHLFPLGCKLSLAAELHSRGESRTAARLGAECVAHARELLGEHHPFTGAFRVNHLLFRQGSGHLEQVLAEGPGVLSDLTDRLDDGHPWVIAAAVNHSVALAKAHQPDEALAYAEGAYQDTLSAIHAKHPTTVAAAGNLEIIRQLVDQPTASATDVTEYPWQEIDIHLP